MKIGSKILIKSEQLQDLLNVLKSENFKVIGPKISDDVIVYDDIHFISELPKGWTDEQEKGHYRLKKNTTDTYFGYTVSPQSWKKYLHPPVDSLWKAQKKGKSFSIIQEEKSPPKYAFLGVKACELNAIQIQDNVFLEGEYVNNLYKEIRENIFIIALNCSRAASTCFCVSTNTGPEVKNGFDLSLTEIFEEKEHSFLVTVGTEKGLQILKQIKTSLPSEKQTIQEKEVIKNTIEQMVRKPDLTNVKEKLAESYDSKYWEEISKVCLTCANCTMVCPTCFCTSVEDVTDLKGELTERIRKWDSCFTLDFSYVHGGSVRQSSSSRYRQWLTHKFSSWHDQFGTSGCTGCGRCITWCPVGIDVTESINKIVSE